MSNLKNHNKISLHFSLKAGESSQFWVESKQKSKLTERNDALSKSRNLSQTIDLAGRPQVRIFFFFSRKQSSVQLAWMCALKYWKQSINSGSTEIKQLWGSMVNIRSSFSFVFLSNIVEGTIAPWPPWFRQHWKCMQWDPLESMEGRYVLLHAICLFLQDILFSHREHWNVPLYVHCTTFLT